MRQDPIVQEVRQYREERAAKFNYNLHAIVEDARKREQQSGRMVVSYVRPHTANHPADR